MAGMATPLATGGVAMIRLSGEEAISIAERVFRSVNGKKLQDLAGYTACYGEFYQGETRLDDGVALVFRAPKSYAGEEVVELFCHGGIYATRELLRTVIDAGSAHAVAGECSKRALLTGKMSLSTAEAVIGGTDSQRAT